MFLGSGHFKGHGTCVYVCSKAHCSDTPDDSTAGGTIGELSKRAELLLRVIKSSQLGHTAL